MPTPEEIQKRADDKARAAVTPEQKHVLDQWANSLLTRDEMLQKLDALQVRGGVEGPKTFLGYDYKNQAWIFYEGEQ
jgi:hypothetical protein